MIEMKKASITAIDIQEAQTSLNDLLRRAQTGEEIVITDAGKPDAMVASPKNIQILSNVGAISFELPFDMGG